MRGMGKFTVGHCIKSIISLILPAGEPLKPFLLFYILFETEAGPAVKRVYCFYGYWYYGIRIYSSGRKEEETSGFYE